MLWAVANTLTVFAIRDVGLTIAFPLWNTNSLVGIFWGWLLFGELNGASGKNVAKVLLGALAIVVAAIMLGLQHHSGRRASRPIARGRHSGRGGREPAVGHDVHSLSQGLHQRHESALVRHRLHDWRTGHGASRWCWRLMAERRRPIFHSPADEAPDLLALSRWICLGDRRPLSAVRDQVPGHRAGIPLSNTNQLWGLAWGALVFGELAHADWTHRLLVVAGIGGDDPRRACGQYGGCDGARKRIDQRRRWSGSATATGSTTTACSPPTAARRRRTTASERGVPGGTSDCRRRGWGVCVAGGERAGARAGDELWLGRGH